MSNQVQKARWLSSEVGLYHLVLNGMYVVEWNVVVVVVFFVVASMHIQ